MVWLAELVLLGRYKGISQYEAMVTEPWKILGLPEELIQQNFEKRPVVYWIPSQKPGLYEQPIKGQAWKLDREKCHPEGWGK